MAQGFLKAEGTSREIAVKFTLVALANERQTRKPQIYALLRRWDANGPSIVERRALEADYGRWLDRNRVTAEMAAVLLLRHLAHLRYRATDPEPDPAGERDRMTQVLMIRRGLRGLSEPEAALLADLEMLQRRVNTPYVVATSPDGLRVYAESASIRSAYEILRASHRETIRGLLGPVDARIHTHRVVNIPRRRAEGSLPRGEAKEARQRLKAFEKELGRTFLHNSTSMKARAAQVRKWRQFAINRS